MKTFFLTNPGIYARDQRIMVKWALAINTSKLG